MDLIKIGTRNSPLALWQAREVARHLQNKNYITDIIPIVSSEEMSENYNDDDKEMFTKDLDLALQNSEIDIAVHSLKDVPFQLPENIKIVAYLERDFAEDVLIRNSSSQNIPLQNLKIATTDARRKAFWLKEFPDSEFLEAKGNATTRLHKIEKDEVDATVISLARVKRLQLNLNYERVPFIIPAPSQGVIAALGRIDNEKINSLLHSLNDDLTEYCAENERGFQSLFSEREDLIVGAFAEIVNDQIRFKGIVCSRDGKNSFETDDIFPLDFTRNIGKEMGIQVLKEINQF